jgi:hypothetical protein
VIIFQRVIGYFSTPREAARASATLTLPGRCGNLVAIALLVSGACLLTSACAGLGAMQSSANPSNAAVTPPEPDLSVYLATLDQLSPGDPVRQSAELASALAASEATPTAANRLRYALALGAAGHPGSDPVEARRLIVELLAGPHDLGAEEVALASAFLREFDARVTLYADIARQREDFERQLKSSSAEEQRRVSALSAENQRLKKSLAEAERKLSAVAEMERALLENAAEAPAPDAKPPE